MKKILLFLIFTFGLLYSFEINGNPKNWNKSDLVGMDKIGDAKFLGDISSVFMHFQKNNTFIRITFNDMVKREHNKTIQDNFKNKNILLSINDDKFKIPLDRKSYKNKKITLLRTTKNNLV